MNTQRRVFRGRGGPKDGRLPKHNARRRKHNTGPRKPASSKYEEEDQRQQLIQSREAECANQDVDMDRTPHSEEEKMGDVERQIMCEDNHDLQSLQTPNSADDTEDAPPPWLDEIKHLKQRLKNVQESMQTSQGISNLDTYGKNVLNAVENGIQEWRAIVKYYPDLDQGTIRNTALQVYILLQFALQCGPLAGGKPGYFKRCGSAVAQIVLTFLNRAIPVEKDTIIHELGFSEKQSDAIASWRVNAAKAVEANKPPSKTAMKKQEEKSKKKKIQKSK